MICLVIHKVLIVYPTNICSYKSVIVGKDKLPTKTNENLPNLFSPQIRKVVLSKF